MLAFDIVTSADDEYAFFVRELALNVASLLGTRLVVYDLGISESSKSGVNARFIPLQVPGDYKETNELNCVRTIHKPACIRDWAERSPRPFVFMDADCLISQRFDFPECGVGVTFKHYAEQTCSDFSKNGVINAGVLFFNPYASNPEDRDSFLSLWENLCSQPGITDQKALSDLLCQKLDFMPGKWDYAWKSTKVAVLPSEKYNDIRQKTGVIWHFKDAFRARHKRNAYFDLLNRIMNRPLVNRLSIFYSRFVLGVKRFFRPKKYMHRYEYAWEKFKASQAVRTGEGL